MRILIDAAQIAPLEQIIEGDLSVHPFYGRFCDSFMANKIQLVQELKTNDYQGGRTFARPKRDVH